MPLRPLRPVLAALATLLVTSACNRGNEADNQRAVPVKSEARSAAALPTKAARPSAAPKLRPPSRTDGGAVAFVRTYYAAVNKAAVTGNAKGLTSYALSKCKMCRAYVQTSRNLQADHARFNGPPFVVKFAEPYPAPHNNRSVVVTVDAPARNVLNGAGRVLERIPSTKRFSMSVGLTWRTNRWVINDIISYG